VQKYLYTKDFKKNRSIKKTTFKQAIKIKKQGSTIIMSYIFAQTSE